MPARRELTMRQLRQMLRLHHDGVSAREIGRTLGVARSTIQDNLERARVAGIGWPLPAEWTDEFLEQRLFGRAGVKPGRRRHTEPDWAALARELKRSGVNLMVLWEEYRESHPDGYGYSRFCDLYREFERRLSPVMRQHHVAGDKVFVDYSGKKIAIVDPSTGEVRDAEIFVAVLGASNYTYAEATWTQALPDWIEAHVRMFRFFAGVPRLVVPDNLKSGVHKASFYDPEINRSYAMMAAHYGVGILPARPYRPRDKAKVEAGVKLAQTYILGRLRHQTFFSLAEANRAIALALERMNGHVMRRLGLSRSDLFASVERSALRALPATDYEFAEWRLARVGLDYHVEVEGFYYSVPHALIRAQVDPAHHQPHHRGVPPRQTRRCPSASLRRSPSWHRSRPHAERASALRRMVAGTLPALGALDRSQHRGAGDRRARQPPASGTGLSNLPRCAALVPWHRPGSRRSRRGSRTRHRGAHLQERRLHSQKQSRSRSTGR